MRLCERHSELSNTFDTHTTDFSDEILRNVAEVVWPRDVGVVEQILIWVLRLITIPEEQLEEVEEADPIELRDGTLQTRQGSNAVDNRTSPYSDQRLSGFAADPEIIVRYQQGLRKCA